MAYVSIGLPVYNGERYIAEAIGSILEQTFTDFELVICDNASCDATEEICRRYAEKDPRVRYHRNDRNIGAGPNFNLAFRMCSGRYFKWAAHDDLVAPEYLESCVSVLDREPDVVLCHSEVVRIDSEGGVLPDYEGVLEGGGSRKVSERFRRLISLYHSCFEIFGVMRRDVLEETPLIASYIGSDRNLLVDLALRGRFHRVPKPLFFSRDHADRSLRAMNFYDRGLWWDPALAGKKIFPWWRILVEYVKSLRRAPIGFHEKVECAAAFPIWLRHNWRFLLRDLSHAMTGVGRVAERPAPEGEEGEADSVHHAAHGCR